MLTHVDARSCLSCHREHRPEARQRGSVSVASDFCFPCHADIATERPSHQGLAATSCADVACHNYHDNRALYEDLLTRERAIPALRSAGTLPLTSAIAPFKDALSPGDADIQEGEAARDARASWARSSHAAGGVNCRDCHAPAALASAAVADGAATADVRWKVPAATCGGCHPAERAGFEASKHGMRLGVGLSAMQPELARLPMHGGARGRSLDCNSCHRAHEFDRLEAAVEACEGCHDDRHTRSYRGSSHFALMQSEWAGRAEAGTGVSCASCHLPRRAVRREGRRQVLAIHNQNDNLRPVDRMARDVCMHCHGLGYALEALADRALVERNFIGAPGKARTAMSLVKGEETK
jgi:predicted CXXCH cytochrome family protein